MRVCLNMRMRVRDELEDEAQHHWELRTGEARPSAAPSVKWTQEGPEVPERPRSPTLMDLLGARGGTGGGDMWQGGSGEPWRPGAPEVLGEEPGMSYEELAEATGEPQRVPPFIAVKLISGHPCD